MSTVPDRVGPPAASTTTWTVPEPDPLAPWATLAHGTLLAAVSFDQTGTTKIGKYLLNHSFMLPGLVTIFSTILIALLLSKFVV